VIFYLVYAAGGVTGLICFKSAVIFATCAALLGACRYLRCPLTIVIPVMALMLFIGSARFFERPHIFSYLFEAIYLLCYFAFREGGRRRAWLYAIPPLHIVWTNLHGGHLQGLFLLVMLAAAELVISFRARWLGLRTQDALEGRDVGLVCALPLGCLLAALVNPYGYRLVTFPFELTGQEIFMREIYEWQSALIPSYNATAMFLYYIFWIAILFGSFLLVRGHAELHGLVREMAWALNLVLAVLWVVFVYQLAGVYKSQDIPSVFERQSVFWFGVVVLFLVANLHRLEFPHAGIVALFFALSIRHNRAVTDASVATLPVLSHNLTCLFERFQSRGRRAPPWLHPLLMALVGLTLFALSVFTFTSSYYFAFDPPAAREMGLGVASNMPAGAVDYIGRAGITGNGFPSYSAAAMLIQRMWPDVKVAMDSRNDVYGEALYREYVGALAGGAALEAYLGKWPVDFFLISYLQDRNPALFRYLESSPDWTLVYFDDQSVVYLRESPRFQEILRRDGYELINPAVPGTVEFRPEDGHRWLAEAERAVAAAPGSWSPLQYKAKALLSLGRVSEAEAVTRQILDLNPAAYFAWGDLGFIHLMRREEARAEEAFNRCLSLKADYQPCRDGLSRLGGRRP